MAQGQLGVLSLGVLGSVQLGSHSCQKERACVVSFQIM